MSLDFELSVDISQPYNFDKASLAKIDENLWVKSQWPLVYFLQNALVKLAYVGESTNASNRIRDHLTNPDKRDTYTQISIIGSDKFNKSVTLDIESNLIQYISAEGTYKLGNGNFGLINHQYYQKDLYKNLFMEVWDKLMQKGIVSRSLKEIENSELFKYSPYKSLNEDQYNSGMKILEALCDRKANRIFVRGSAGTGKTILATYLIKLLYSDLSCTDENEFSEEELREVNYIKKFQERYPKAKIGLVVAMSSLRESLKNVFQNVPGLKASMVISPTDAVKSNEKYDLLIVDEAHRLRQYRNIGWLGVFKKNNEKLGLGDTGTELDWILAKSKNQIFFYDSEQSVKPSDVNEEDFQKLLRDETTVKLELKSQMRVKGGLDYINFVDELLNIKRASKIIYAPKDYDILVFDSLVDLYRELEAQEYENGLCRLVAGYAWPWASKENKEAFDIQLDGLQFQWNQTDKDWINSTNAFKEIGCIHTTQAMTLTILG